MVYLYDTTLRDGAQQEGISISIEDKLRITQKLDELGVHFIEGGFPGANPKEDEYFIRARALKLNNSKLVAFGSTRRVDGKIETDAQIKALLAAETEFVTVVGKSWDLHVTQILETDLTENLLMISESIAYLRKKGRRVFFDAEHFFDGFNENPEYALEVVKTAWEAGAESVVLCDTNGGSLPHLIGSVVQRVKLETDATLGIHAHNDAEVAVANSLVAFESGVEQIQGTINGYGERCGNANLLSIIANLKLKLGIDCVTDEQLARLQEVHLSISEMVNMPPQGYQPYVGLSAFSHKGGLHASAVLKLEKSYQHIDPQSVGNSRRVVVSELAGRGNLNFKLKEFGLAKHFDDTKIANLVRYIKELESKGYQFDGAEASLEVLIRRNLPHYKAPFELVDFFVVIEKRRRVSGNQSDDNQLLSEASVKVQVGSSVLHTVAEGNGPVNALDQALRKAILQFYPHLEVIQLNDYKVRVVNSVGTEAIVRVIIDSSDGEHRWQTVGASGNIVEASWQALADSLEYWLAKYGS
jgi:2-isopropylmalate synthase